MEKQPYEAPAVVEYGEIDEVTQGSPAINLDDAPLGAKIIAAVEGGGS